MMVIAQHTVVSMNYVMRNRRGEVVEDRMEGVPVEYLQGSQTIPTALQAQLEGMRKGERRVVVLRAGEDGVEDDYAFEVVVHSLRAASEEEMLLGYALPAGDGLCGEDCICHTKPG